MCGKRFSATMPVRCLEFDCGFLCALRNRRGIRNRQNMKTGAMHEEIPVKTKFLRAWILASLIFLIASAANTTAQDKPLKKIYWGVSTLSPNLWIPWIAKEAKIFEKNGLDVESVLLRGSGQTSQAMVAGSLFASSVASPAVMLANLNGADLANVAHGIAAQGSKLMVKPEIRKPEDLRGKKVGISSLGSAGDLIFG